MPAIFAFGNETATADDRARRGRAGRGGGGGGGKNARFLVFPAFQKKKIIRVELGRVSYLR